MRILGSALILATFSLTIARCAAAVTWSVPVSGAREYSAIGSAKWTLALLEPDAGPALMLESGYEEISWGLGEYLRPFELTFLAT
jgi:hypothetical protein